MSITNFEGKKMENKYISSYVDSCNSKFLESL